ncbi:MAG: hypothetical protein HKN11_15680 [Rhizobiales bacterium]|nr:hypothetical protein [Hyphomicrobiales bacterium]
MKIRLVLLASVCTALLAASAAVPAVSATAEKSSAALASENAYKALVSGRSLDAIKLYAEAIESRQLGPDLLANSLLNRALAFQNVGQHQEAIDDYSAALRIDAMGPKLRSVALYNRGLAHHKIAKPAMAIEDFTSALFLDVGFSQAYYSRGNVLRRSGQFLFALSDYEKAMKYSHPEPHLPLYGTALTYESLRRPQEAQSALVKALALKPDFMAAREMLTTLIQPEGNQPATDKGAEKKVAARKLPASFTISNDALVTGSVLGGNPDMVMRKEGLPAPVSPPGVVQHLAKVVPASTNAQLSAAEQIAGLQAPPIPELPKKAEVVKVSAVVDQAGEPAARPNRQPHGWAVQISSQKREDAAWSMWKKMQTKHASLLRPHEANVIKADLGDRGIFFRLRVTGLDDRSAASKLCKRLKARGTSCFVARPS